MRRQALPIAIILLILSHLPSLGLHAQTTGSIQGKILDAESQLPVAYELVTLDGDIKTLTAEDGTFSFLKVTAGQHTLEPGGLGYEKQARTIQVNAGVATQLEAISLSQKMLTIPTQSIMAQAPDLHSGTRVSLAKLQQIQPVGTEEVLRTVPGVNIAGDMGISNRLNVGIRGSYPRRAEKLLVLEDGSPVAPAQYLAPAAYYNPPSERIDGIEVIKGADLVGMGPHTIFGAINYVTRRPPLEPRLHLQITGGENGYNSLYMAYGGTWNNTGAEVQLLRKQFDGFQDNSSSLIHNFTGKVTTYLSEKSTLYVKLNYHNEESNATYAGMTPFTFSHDPRQNPFDADIIRTERVALDVKHNLQIGDHLVLNSHAYGNHFTRDWWRQNTTVILASNALSYLGEAIHDDRYSYLSTLSMGPDDYVRVGRITNGRENTTAHNRFYYQGGIQENLKWNWGAGHRHTLDAGLRFHRESYEELELGNDSTRWAFTGPVKKNDRYTVSAPSAYVKNEFVLGKLRLTPGLRAEWITLEQTKKLDASKDPNYSADSLAKYQRNNGFLAVMPGAGASYAILNQPATGRLLVAHGGIHKGYSPPTSGFGFFAVDENNVSKTPDADDINMKAETSLNYEAGIKANMLRGIEFAATGFSQNIRNFYSAGRNEAFESLGRVTMNGVEMSACIKPTAWIKGNRHHSLELWANGTLMQSRVRDGRLADSDLLTLKHTDATREEIINLINANPEGFEVYYRSAAGGDSLVTGSLTTADFGSIKKLVYVLGEDGIRDRQAPYVPRVILSAGINYSFHKLRLGATLTMVGSQYTDYLNLENETAEGATGKLDGYRNLDVNAGYSFSLGKGRNLTVFAAGKNIENNIYKASRLHRSTSGIMPGGFRQLNGGIILDF